jgi:hypothetical protein
LATFMAVLPRLKRVAFDAPSIFVFHASSSNARAAVPIRDGSLGTSAREPIGTKIGIFS